jgi:site-specific DNA recombinase
VCKHALGLLTSPYDIWKKGDFAAKNTVLRLVFAERPAYDPKSGLQTAEITFPFRWLRALESREVEMVEGAGFEPA